MLVVGGEERSSVGGATLDSGSWRLFLISTLCGVPNQC